MASTSGPPTDGTSQELLKNTLNHIHEGSRSSPATETPDQPAGVRRYDGRPTADERSTDTAANVDGAYNDEDATAPGHPVRSPSLATEKWDGQFS